MILCQGVDVLPGHVGLPDGPVGEVDHGVALLGYLAVQLHHSQVLPVRQSQRWQQEPADVGSVNNSDGNWQIIMY